MKKKTVPQNVEHFTREFNKRKPNYDALREEALHTIEKRLRESGIKIHSIPSRVKDLDSFLGKIDRKQYENPFEQMQDFVGLRIICLFLSDISKIGEIIRESFEVIESEDKVDGGDTSSFGYMSVHHIVKFGDNVKGDRYDDIKGFPFEIQVRTIAMDSWANVSHYLEYKSEQDIPDELKRDFNALSGMFYVADKHFQLFFEQRREKQEEIAETFEKGNIENQFNQPINLDTLTAYLHEKFPDRKRSSSSDISSFIDNIKFTKYSTIGDLEELLNNSQNAFDAYEKEQHEPLYFTDIGVLRVSANISDEEFINTTYPNEKDENYKKRFTPYRKFLKTQK